MKPKSTLAPFLRGLICFMLLAVCLAAFPADASAAGSDAALGAAPAPTLLVADFFQQICGNRSRLIQVSFLCIVVGIFILWKK